MRIGHHVSIAGSVVNAALQAVEIGANTLQIFSSSPRQWKGSKLSLPDVARFRKEREKHDLTPLVIHDNYLINLASRDGNVRNLSIAAFREELERALILEADFLVAHPGNYKDQTLEQGLLNIIQALATASAGLNTGSLTVLLENTVGAGGGVQVGGRFEELKVLREFALQHTGLRIGFCIDTCHTHASGYDLATPDGAKKTFAEMEGVLGFENIHVIHANDSKAPLGSHIDRHEHIGKGYIGEHGFRRILTHPKLRHKPFLLETPVDQPGDERRDIEILKSLCRNSRTTIKKSS
ncbi:MAG: deoxyribonuclease IV [Bryobacteraceae bacterium]